MATIPKLTTSDGSTYAVTFTKGHEFPWDHYYSDQGNQDIEYTRDGYGIVKKNGDEKRILKFHVKGETASVALGVGFLFGSTYVDFMVNTFRYYPDKDVAGTYFSMRLTKPVVVARMLDTVSTDRRYEIIIDAKEE